MGKKRNLRAACPEVLREINNGDRFYPLCEAPQPPLLKELLIEGITAWPG